MVVERRPTLRESSGLDRRSLEIFFTPATVLRTVHGSGGVAFSRRHAELAVNLVYPRDKQVGSTVIRYECKVLCYYALTP